MTINGVDTIHRGLTGATLKAHGYVFDCRYVLNSPVADHLDKQMSVAEVREKSAAGVRIVSNFEWDPSPTNTIAEGKAHANAFLGAHHDLGGPDWAPCYYSVDTAAGVHAYDAYAHGWADVLGPERCGVYGDGALFRQLKADGLVHYAWQSMSTSFPGNRDHTGADIIQTGSGTISGFSCDFNTAVTALYGGWLLGEEDPTMPTADEIAKAVLETPSVTIPPGFNNAGAKISLQAAMSSAMRYSLAARNAALAEATPADIAAAVMAAIPPAQLGGLTVEQVEQAVANVLTGGTDVVGG